MISSSNSSVTPAVDPARAAQQPVPADSITRDGRNIFGVMTLFAGICSWVPFVVVVAFPLAATFALLSVGYALRTGRFVGLNATGVGLVMAILGLSLQIAVAALCAAFGWFW